MVSTAASLRAELAVRLSQPDTALRAVHADLQQALGHALNWEQAAEHLALAATAAAGALLDAAELAPEILRWLLPQSTSWEAWALDTAAALRPPAPLAPAPRASSGMPCEAASHSTGPSASDWPSAGHLLPALLQRLNPAQRRGKGAYYTPPVLARFLVAQAEQVLHETCGTGWSDPDVWLLEPACGSGVFLLTLVERWSAAGQTDLRSLPGRLVALDTEPAAVLAARCNLAAALLQSGRLRPPYPRVPIQLASALDPAAHAGLPPAGCTLPVVLGNPPFHSLSGYPNPWIARLVRGDATLRGYLRAGKQRLGQRKTWLHDDYVKFLRMAQWHVERAGRGVVALVANHGWLDNLTFRLMRQEIVRVFPHLSLFDLHGNRKKHEQSPDGRPDENVFGIASGVCLLVLARPGGLGQAMRPAARAPDKLGQASAASAARPSQTSPLVYHELWGTREAKLRQLAHWVECPLDLQCATGWADRSPLPARGECLVRCCTLAPQPPHWRLTPVAGECPSADEAWPLDRIMPVHAPAPITARDGLVVAPSRQELIRRIEAFCDLSIPDETIRSRYFRTRSTRYPRGDTRSWSLSEARRRLAAQPQWPHSIRRCLYRPFDWRYILWHPAMIDWPRTEVTRHLVDADLPAGCRPLCLLTRRRQLPTQPCSFFWVSDGLALDGVIRSDNHGSELLFPVYVRGSGPGTTPSWEANFAPAWIERLVRATGLQWQPLGRGDLDRTLGPEDAAACLYALFHAPRFRREQREALQQALPRVPPPRGPQPFVTLARLGRQLLELHLLWSPWLHDPAAVAGVAESEAVARFRVGTYEVLRRWQKAVQNRPWPARSQVVAAISQTLALLPQLDACLE